MLLELMEHFKLKNDLKNYRKGIVVSNEDPEKIGRVKVTIEGLFVDISDSYNKLPWVYCNNPIDFSGNGSTILPPDVGSALRITWVDDDIYFPVYDGYWLDKTNSPCIADGFYSEFTNNYGKVKGWQDKHGNYELYNTETNDYEKNHNSGVNVKIDNEGNYTLSIDGIGKIKSNDLNLGDTDTATKKLVTEDHLAKYDSFIDAVNAWIVGVSPLLILPAPVKPVAPFTTSWTASYGTIKENGTNKTDNTKAN